MPASIFNGTSVKILKNILKFNDGTTLSSTIAGYLSTISSSVQTQLDAKQARSTLTTKGDIYVATGAGAVTNLPVGIDGTVITADSSEASGLNYSSPASTLAIRSVTTTDTPSTTDDCTLVCSGSSFTLTLPTPASGKVYKLIHAGSFGELYTLNTTAGATIGGIASGAYILSTPGETLEVQFNGTNYIILNHVAKTAPTSYATPTTQGLGTLGTSSFIWWRDGAHLEVSIRLTAGTVAASEMRVGLPSGLTSADSTVIPTRRLCGYGTIDAAAVASYTVLIEASSTFFCFSKQSTSHAGLTKNTGSNVLATGDVFTFFAKIPIAGWQP